MGGEYEDGKLEKRQRYMGNRVSKGRDREGANKARKGAGGELERKKDKQGFSVEEQCGFCSKE